MKSGDLDRLVIIEQKSDTQDSYGEAVPTWTTFATVWAKVVPFSATELFKSAADHSQKVNKFYIRYLTGVTEVMRINYDGLYWRILGIQEINRKRGWEILAEVYK